MRKVILLAIFIFSFCPLHAVSDNIEIKADSFELDANENVVLAIGNVIVKQQDVTIFGDQGKYDQKLQSIRLVDNIHIKKGEITLQCEIVTADGLKNTILAEKKVSFTMGLMSGSAKRAFYNIDDNVVTLTGNPIVHQGTDSLKGDTIILEVDKQKVITKGRAKAIIASERLGD